MSYNLYVVSPRPYSESAFLHGLGIDVNKYLMRPTNIQHEAWAKQEAQEHGEQAEDQGNDSGDGSS